ncbi:hypothetical protein ACFC1R_24270 [Kitasatospora sp. NPDC056138]|uniref:hypothetical protein n=1 Tax=Kitasatospora sp. NPDC056138 TaxID=3345724 RepID=UPI0035D81DCD
MTVRRSATAVLLAAALLGSAPLLTACGPTSAAPAPPNPASSATPTAPATQAAGGSDDAQLKDMQQKVDAADSAAAQADSDAAKDN